MPTVSRGTLLGAVVGIRSCSKTAARKLLEAGAVKVNGTKEVDPDFRLQKGDIIQAGKRGWGRVL